MKLASLVICSSLALSSEGLAQSTEWPEKWERVRGWEYGMTGTLLSWAFFAKLGLPDPGSHLEELPYELDLSRAILVESGGAQRTLVLLTDLSLALGLAYPVLDAIFAAGVAHGDWDLAWQMSMVSLESVASFLAILWTVQAAVGRQRPHAKLCALDPSGTPDYACEIDSTEVNRSLIAGHTAGAWVGAGLTCVHHGQLPLYGGGWPDYLACGTMITAAVLNGVGRLAIGAHYVSDVLLGAVVGVFSGFVLPSLLHYGFGPYRQQLSFRGAREVREESATSRLMVTPMGLGLGISGVF